METNIALYLIGKWYELPSFLLTILLFSFYSCGKVSLSNGH